MAAVVWLIIGVILVVAEVLSGDFVLLMLGVGGLSAALAAALVGGGVGLPVSVATFAVVAVGGVVLARPALKRRMHLGHHVKTNVEALIGVRATVVSTVDAHQGQVKIGGELWSARAYDETQVIPPGRSVTVMEISGATAVVWDGP